MTSSLNGLLRTPLALQRERLTSQNVQIISPAALNSSGERGNAGIFASTQHHPVSSMHLQNLYFAGRPVVYQKAIVEEAMKLLNETLIPESRDQFTQKLVQSFDPTSDIPLQKEPFTVD
jgi:hypothetical protein